MTLTPSTAPFDPPQQSADTIELQWVPVKSLGAEDRGAIAEHLLALSTADRYLRFGHAASDEQVARYVAALDFGRDDVFGVFNRQLMLVALAHLAFAPDGSVPIAEYGVSVSAHLRNRGFGKRLFAHAVLKARNRDVDTLMIHALSENQVMLSIARAAGATVERQGSDAQALLKLPGPDMASRWEAWLETHAADIDYGVKQQARRWNQLKAALTPGSK